MDSEQQRSTGSDTERELQPRTDRAARLALIEVEGRDGRPQRLVDVHAWPLTLGRAIDNDIVIDDPHVAPHHARLLPGAGGSLTLEVLDTRNGVQIGKRLLARGSSEALPAGGSNLQLGSTGLRLRLPGEQLAPEKPLPLQQRRGLALALAAGALMVAMEFFSHWLTLDPGADYSSWLSTVIGLPAALLAWCSLWALLSKLFRHRFDFTGHLRIALPWLLGISLASSLLPQLCAMLNLPALWHTSNALQAILLALMVRAHLAQALPAHPRAVTAAVALGALAWGGISLAGIYRASDSLSSAPYMSTLPLPALRLAGTTSPQALVQDMAPLAEQLTRRARQAREEDRDGGDDDSSEE